MNHLYVTPDRVNGEGRTGREQWTSTEYGNRDHWLLLPLITTDK